METVIPMVENGLNKSKEARIRDERAGAERRARASAQRRQCQIPADCLACQSKLALELSPVAGGGPLPVFDQRDEAIICITRRLI